GNNDPFFLPPGEDALQSDNPKAEEHFYDTGHFALETHSDEIGDAIRNFLTRNLAAQNQAA
ncbi:MAG: alpha/beta fold hydrolase, partial [Acidobacteriaceae bacterium]